VFSSGGSSAAYVAASRLLTCAQVTAFASSPVRCRSGSGATRGVLLDARQLAAVEPHAVADRAALDARIGRQGRIAEWAERGGAARAAARRGGRRLDGGLQAGLVERLEPWRLAGVEGVELPADRTRCRRSAGTGRAGGRSRSGRARSPGPW
jgi:hypothetical protein